MGERKGERGGRGRGEVRERRAQLFGTVGLDSLPRSSLISMVVKIHAVHFRLLKGWCNGLVSRLISFQGTEKDKRRVGVGKEIGSARTAGKGVCEPTEWLLIKGSNRERRVIFSRNLHFHDSNWIRNPWEKMCARQEGGWGGGRGEYALLFST